MKPGIKEIEVLCNAVGRGVDRVTRNGVSVVVVVVYWIMKV